MLNQKLANKTSVLSGICSALASTLVISQAVLYESAHAAGAQASALAFTHPKKTIPKYQVSRGDTLLKIAKHLAPENTHYYQVAIALFLKNPEAFSDNRLNKLILGSDIVIPNQGEAAKISLSLAHSLMLSTQNDSLKKLLTKNQKAREENIPEDTAQEAVISEETIPKKIVQEDDSENISEPDPENITEAIIPLPKDETTTIPERKEANDLRLSKADTLSDNATEEVEVSTDTETISITISNGSEPVLSGTQPTTGTSTNEAGYLVSPLEEELMAEVTAIRSSVDSLREKLPSTQQQKEDQARYLQTLQKLVDQLAQKIKTHDQEQLVYEKQIKALLAEQERLLDELTFYQQAYNTLKPVVRHANFIAPYNINQREQVDPNSFFRHIATNNRWNKPLSPLLEKTEALYCATEELQANSVLHDFFNISPKEVDWPDEWMGKNPSEAMLYAGTMDILLSTLYRNIYRFPGLTELTERVTLQWDYCSVTGNGGSFYNLLLREDEELISQKAAPNVPLGWSGFNQWGFMIPPPPEYTRYVPELLEVREPFHAFEIFLHQVYQQHCFPHPVTGKVYTETDEERVLTRVFHPPRPIEALQSYPYTWMPFCKIPEVEHWAKAAWPRHLLQRASYNVSNTKNKKEEVTQTLSEVKKEKSGKQKPFRLASKKLEEEINSLKLVEQKRKAGIKSRLAKIEKLKTLAKKTEEEAYEKIEVAQRQAAAERRRVEQEVAEKRRIQRQAEVRRLAELEAEKIRIVREEKRLAKIKAEEQKKAARKAEIKRLAKLAAEKKRKIEAEKVRQAKQLAEKKRLAKLKAEKERLAKLKAERLLKAKAEKIRLAKIAAENKRNATLQAMRQRMAGVRKAKFADFADPPDDFIPMPDANGNTPVIHSKKTKDGKDKYNITTTLIYTAPLSGAKHSGKLNVSWTPRPNWFARGSLKYVDNEELTYSWGVGYSPWRPGTTSVQLNNWGPIKMGEGLALDKAVLSIGHKIDSEFLRDKKISTALGFSKPLSGDPGVSATFQWSPVKNWYFRTTAAQKISGGPTNWSYGFGHFDWRPETWRVEYSNYGKNRYPFDNFKQGAVTINRAWQF